MEKLGKDKIGQLQYILIIMVWLLLFATPILFGNFEDGINWNHITKIWQEYSILLIIFLANRFVLMPQLFFKGRRILYFTSIVGIILLLSVVLYYVQIYFGGRGFPGAMPPPGPMGPRGMTGPKEHIPPYANLIIMSILLIGFDSGLLFFSKWMKSEQKKLKAEKESVANKMAFLQNQVSPHFFMNTLNNIHALVDIDTEEAKDAIIRLSKMMDYMLYDSQTSSISLEKEIEFITSYVELMKLRLTDDVGFVFDIPELLPQVKVPPLLTISFIENAFKYGISYEEESYIHIRFKLIENSLIFMVENKIHNYTDKRKGRAIGIKNTKKRLDLLYGDKYELLINENNDKFIVNLKIPL